VNITTSRNKNFCSCTNCIRWVDCRPRPISITWEFFVAVIR